MTEGVSIDIMFPVLRILTEESIHHRKIQDQEITFLQEEIHQESTVLQAEIIHQEATVLRNVLIRHLKEVTHLHQAIPMAEADLQVVQLDVVQGEGRS